jgi:hypothetical protein
LMGEGPRSKIPPFDKLRVVSEAEPPEAGVRVTIRTNDQMPFFHPPFYSLPSREGRTGLLSLDGRGLRRG